MGNRFEGRVAAVTGSGQSIGLEIAHLLAREGARVVLNSRTEVSRDATPTAADAARVIVDEGGEALAVFADVSRMDGAAAVVGAAIERWGRLDILVNNAGGAYGTQGIEDTGEQAWDGLMAANLKSQYACTHFAVPHMRRAGYGRILNIGSPIGMFGMAQMTAYCAAKGGVMGLTLALAHELLGSGISVNCLLPSAATERANRTRAAREAVTGVVVSRNPDRIPAAIAAPAVHLLAESAGAISGQMFEVSAGRIKHFPWPPPARELFKAGIWTLDELDTAFDACFGTTLPPVPYKG
ncbi:MAG: SDR family NAD(P)-dependent oxidoreductase [Gammaproteobacteria bacterium]